MEGSERDSTQDWLLPDGAAPPLIGELVGRIDEALTIARASESAVVQVGAMALDAAERARLAAEAAERAGQVALDAGRAAAEARPEPPSQASEDASLRRFGERADRVIARLRALERRPRRVPLSGAAGGRERPPAATSRLYP